jgi:sec-independent protein translocase protein TatC
MALFKKKNTEREREMSFLEHLEELRWHIIRSLGAIVTIAISVFLLKSFIFNSIIFAPKRPDFATYKFFCWISERTCFGPPEFDLITRELGEQFFTHIKVSFWLGLIVAFPYIFFEFWKFIKPGLYETERKAARGIVLVCSFLFISGVIFGYYVISPFAISWLAGYVVGAEAINAPTLASYVNYMTMFTIPTGLVFELPVFVYFFSKIGLVTPELMRKYRKHSIIIILILSALITPPDVVTQFLIGVPIFILYEISIAISKRVAKSYQESL